MDIFFVNNLNLPYNNKVRKGEYYDRYIDEFMLPADTICIAGGISQYINVEISFLIHLARKYSHVVYVYGGCDLISDELLDIKFDKIKKNFRRPQYVKCTPVCLDGTILKIDELVFGGSMGFDINENISDWNWWTDNNKEMYDYEVNHLCNVINENPNVILSYYKPDVMNFTNSANIWHYGSSNTKEIIENNGKLIITNGCQEKYTKYNKKDFLIKL